MMSPTDPRPDDEFTRELLEGAGAPPSVPDEDVAAIKRAARAIWQQHHAAPRHRMRSSRWLIPVAAALLGGLVLGWWTLRPRPAAPAPIAARVDRISGTVIASQEPVVASDQLPAGSVLRTGLQSRIALRLAGGQSLRLDTLTTVRLVSSRVVELDRGAVYLDSPPDSLPDGVTIRTTSGEFRPVGTQFEVRLDDAGTAHLRVREGRVVLKRESGAVTAEEGEELIVQRDGTIIRGRFRSDHPSWDWILAAVPMPDIEGRTLRWFLEWVARENGWKLGFDSDRIAALSDTIILHGSVGDLSPEEALRSVTLGSGLAYRVSDGVLTLSQ